MAASPGSPTRWPFARHDVFANLAEEYRMRVIRSLPGMIVWPALMFALVVAAQLATVISWSAAGGPETGLSQGSAIFLGNIIAYSGLGLIMWAWMKRYQAHRPVFAIFPLRLSDFLAAALVMVFMVLIASPLTLSFHEFAMAEPDLTLAGGASRDDLSNVDDFIGAEASLWLLIGLTLIAAPIVEEVLFRGWMLPMMMARGVPALFAIIISALAFGLVHIAQGLMVMTSTFFLALALGAARVWTGRLAAPILGHVANNAWAVFAVPYLISLAPATTGN
ncbi:type II CAAX endopeptidase family protein [Maricaulis sp.]|uniref:CPBP family intramembrane glutamic endopeptidase n=1 Tax=Maricaulis sp. TaxID=1486257 RepID=UPI0025D6B51D|nr:type II CAAX endopeptidase family protein [Maricaulis sp.]MDF1768096.1 type II CAAX endopeptidase family protein [Maricaulis sp.]